MFKTRIKDRVLKDIYTQIQTAQRELNELDKEFASKFAYDRTDNHSKGHAKEVTSMEYNNRMYGIYRTLQGRIANILSKLRF
jgi:hypothetical protein